MNASSPGWKDLIARAEEARRRSRRARDDRPTDSFVAARWDRAHEALDRLDSGDPLDIAPRLSVELVAAYVDDRLTTAEAALVEQVCDESLADLVEIAAELRFAAEARFAAADDSPERSEVSVSFAARLHALYPAAGSASVPPAPVRSTSPSSASGGPTAFDRHAANDAASVPVVALDAARAARPTRRAAAPIPTWALALVGAAVVLLAAVLVVWRLGGASTSVDPRTPDVARRPPSKSRPDEEPHSPRSTPKDEGLARESLPRTAPGAWPPDESPDEPRPPEAPRRPRDVVAGPPKPPAPAPETPRPETPWSVAIRSELGAVLSPAETSGTWRSVRGTRTLDAPLTLVSLADSWTSADVDGLGTLVFEGEAQAVLSRDSDHALRVSLEHGRIGVRNLAENARVRFAAGGREWQATSVGPYSTFAVVRDVEAAGVFVTSGIIAIDATQVASGQMSLVADGVATSPQSTAARPTVSSSPFVSDPYDDRWLKTPDEKRKRDWQATYGKLADRLAAADDAGAELRELRAAARDGRQHALLARWNLSLADDRPAATWEMLGDRQRFVRLAALRELLATPPRDGRLRAYYAAFRAASDGRTAADVLEWVARTHRAGPPLPAQAQELVEGLGHSELAVRQTAAFLLEYYSQDALRAARLRAPAYDPEDPPARRATGQAQWRALAVQLWGGRNRAGKSAN